MKLVKLFSVIFISLLTLFACSNTNESETNDEDRKIVTSIYPIEYIVSEIAGDYVDVETIVPAGADAHSYEPSTKTMMELSSSDGFFFIGEGMESFSETMAESVKGEGVETLKLAEYEELFEEFNEGDQIDVNAVEHDEDDHEDESHEHENEDSHEHDHESEHEEDHEHEEDEHEEHDHAEHEENEHEEHEGEHAEDEHADHDHGDFDPHFWLDPIRMIDAGDVVLEQLITMYPEQEDAFKQNYEAFKTNMKDLDEQYQNGFDQEINILVTHKSFSYIEQRYPVKQYSIRGISSAQEPSQKELQQLFDQINELQIEHMILETNSDDRLAQTIADELGLKQYKLSNLSTRTEEEVQDEKDYYDIMIENLNVLKEIYQ
ncbi:metal ABC transporter substrate-binding protein [Piscibacillus sp. B03]|uniref:metal ABC transporter substrate-binding protein n=1 Tax=Piscibacillus sp. B03 TaxID=3457430 RepID=UPI003FCE0A37